MRIDNQIMNRLMIEQYMNQDGNAEFSVNGESTDADGVNDVLRNNGVPHLQFINNQWHVDGVDGRRPADQYTLSVTTSNDGVPELPDTPGARMPSAQLADRVNYFSSGNISDGALLFVALSTLRERYEKAEDIARQRSHAAGEAVKAYGEIEIKAAYEKVEEQRNAALESLAWSLGAAVVSFAAGAVGSGIGGVAGDGLSSSAQALGQSVSYLGDWVSKSSGAQSRANEAEIHERKMQGLKQMSEQMKQSADQEVEEMKEGKKNALQMLRQHFELELQITRSITNT